MQFVHIVPILRRFDSKENLVCYYSVTVAELQRTLRKKCEFECDFSKEGVSGCKVCAQWYII